jgi:hypothetical protein
MTQKDIRESENATEQNIWESQEGRKEVIVKANDELPLEDVKIFDDLTNQEFCDDRQVKGKSEKWGNVARSERQISDSCKVQ